MRHAFDLARARHAKNPGRPAKVTCVDKANVLSSYAYFRSIFDEVAAEYPNVEKDCNRTSDLGGPATTTQLGDAVVRSIKTLAAERTP